MALTSEPCGLMGADLVSFGLQTHLSHTAASTSVRESSVRCIGLVLIVPPGNLCFTAFSLAAFVGPIMAGQILQSTGTPTGFRIQIGITSALAICCVPLVWFFMVRCVGLAHLNHLIHAG